jgi:hypothetical protein
LSFEPVNAEWRWAAEILRATTLGLLAISLRDWARLRALIEGRIGTLATVCN